MRINPLKPEELSPDLRFVHDEISALITSSQSQVKMVADDGALLGPFAPMLHYPQFGVPALSFLRTLDIHATLDKSVREVAILTVGAAYGARFELYAHQIMAEAFGLSADTIASLAAGGIPYGLNQQEFTAHSIAACLLNGRIVPDSAYNHAIQLFGADGLAELFFLIGGYSLIAVILNGFDMPAPERSA
ncbi:hypothetical protein [Dyadobacter sp. OTU695]|uniref:hypothetical protein n=1 Tax=Dyadobacter sp. OTU695 TaxID=3043860 RepID=UPI00313BF72F